MHIFLLKNLHCDHFRIFFEIFIYINVRILYLLTGEFQLYYLKLNKSPKKDKDNIYYFILYSSITHHKNKITILKKLNILWLIILIFNPFYFKLLKYLK